MVRAKSDFDGILLEKILRTDIFSPSAIPDCRRCGSGDDSAFLAVRRPTELQPALWKDVRVMTPYAARVAVCVLFYCTQLACCASGFAAEIYPGIYGAALRAKLREEHSPTQSLSYRAAREHMFARIDNLDGDVACVYTGVLHRTSTIPNHEVMNAEHTWPQSRFSSGSNSAQMKSDLHHVFATLQEVNSARGNDPFSEIPDEETEKWWKSRDYQRNRPTAGIDQYSESSPGIFEPRERHKGNTARSLLYFYTIYEERGINLAWFRPQIAVLLAWHRQDPPDADEVARSRAIRDVQGNLNPFVEDVTLADRIFQSGDAPDLPPVPVAFIRRHQPLEKVGSAPLRSGAARGRADLAEENRLLRKVVIELELQLARAKSDAEPSERNK